MALPISSPENLAHKILLPDLLILDFDGTLAPITPHPDQSQLSTNTARTLSGLQNHLPVVVLTGRKVSDLKTRLQSSDFIPTLSVGNHGIEGLPGRESWALRARESVISWRETLRTFTWEDTGVFIEDKEFSLSLHYRLAQDPESAQKDLLARVEQLSPPPHVIAGKFVLNLLPPKSPNKGTAVKELLHSFSARSALFLGDDQTDEDGFSVRKEIEENFPGTHLYSVKVGTCENTQAQAVLEDQSKVAPFLAALYDRFRSNDKPLFK